MKVERQTESAIVLHWSRAQAAAKKLNYGRIIGLVAIHGFALQAFFFFPRLIDVILFFVFYLIAGLGVTVGYHRLLAHRGFRCSRPVKLFLAFCGATAFEGGPITWVGVHRKHHGASDTKDDPHSPVFGFFRSHVGWLFYKDDLPKTAVLARDIAGDRFFRLLDKFPFSLAPWLLTLLICYSIGGYRGVLWGGAVRTVIAWHATWSVNSFCHHWGYQLYKTNDESRNLWWVAILTLGEGWHNNHHHSPRSAVHGHKWYELDVSGAMILLLQKIGLAKDVALFKQRNNQ